MEYLIRACEPKDLITLVHLCAKHAAYEKSAYSETDQAEKLHRAIFSDHAPLHCWVVESDSDIVGYATYTFDFSTWSAGYFMHVDCLYLEEAVRGRGIGEKIMRNLVAEAKRRSCVNIQWQTPVFNKSAIRFYCRMGASPLEKQRFTLLLPVE